VRLYIAAVLTELASMTHAQTETQTEFDRTHAPIANIEYNSQMVIPRKKALPVSAAWATSCYFITHPLHLACTQTEAVGGRDEQTWWDGRAVSCASHGDPRADVSVACVEMLSALPSDRQTVLEMNYGAWNNNNNTAETVWSRHTSRLRSSV